jgi:hypothetical protein
MKRLVEFPMEDGSTILVEVDEPGYAGGTLRSIKPGDMIERAGMTYEQAISRVQPAAASIIARLRAMPEPPTEVAIELGISLSAEAGAFLASAATQAHIIVTLTWKAHRHDIVAAPALPLPNANDNYAEEES